MESYKHQFAKNALAGWLRGRIADAQEWLPPNLAPGPDVYAEFPICLDIQNRLHGLTIPWPGQIPTYHQCLDQQLLPLVIFDIAVGFQGTAKFAYEVVHRNPVSAEKALYLPRLFAAGLRRLHEVDATWILRQPRAPGAIERLRTHEAPRA